jgi:hypothetical protein
MNANHQPVQTSARQELTIRPCLKYGQTHLTIAITTHTGITLHEQDLIPQSELTA